MVNHAEYESRLRTLRDEMTTRINAINKDVHHREQAVEKDFAEQTTQRENDEVLNALDHEARAIVQQIDKALLSSGKRPTEHARNAATLSLKNDLRPSLT